jgi:hypothetical protein
MEKELVELILLVELVAGSDWHSKKQEEFLIHHWTLL